MIIGSRNWLKIVW